jgi:hypothetical protein
MHMHMDITWIQYGYNTIIIRHNIHTTYNIDTPSLFGCRKVVLKVVAALGVGSEEELGCLTLASLLRRAKKAGEDPDAGRCYVLINNIDGPSLRNSEVGIVMILNMFTSVQQNSSTHLRVL